MQGSKYGEEGKLDEVFCHDDRLVFRGQKHEVKLDADWWKIVPKTGEVVSWWKPETGEYKSPDDMPEGTGWIACQGRAAMLAKGLSVYAEGAYVDIRMNNLWDDLRKRYRLSLDALVRATDRRILKYTPSTRRKESPYRVRTDDERKTEAVRRRFKKYWHAVAYEHDLILPADIGKELLAELRERDKAGGQYENTVYLKGFQTKESLLVKVYDMQGKHGITGVKVEVTMRQDFLERHWLKSPAAWESQPDIQERIRSTLKREWCRIFQGKVARSMLAERVRVPQAELFDFMADTRNTLAQVLDRISQHDREIADIRRILADKQDKPEKTR